MTIHLINLGPIMLPGAVFIPVGPVYFWGSTHDDADDADDHDATITVRVPAAAAWSPRKIRALVRKSLGRTRDNVLVDTHVATVQRGKRAATCVATLSLQDGQARSPTAFKAVVRALCAAIRASIPGATVRAKTTLAGAHERADRSLEAADEGQKDPGAESKRPR